MTLPQPPDQHDPGSTGGAGVQPPGEDFEPLYPDVEAWVEAVYTTTFPRQGRARWCARWWAHPEAVLRLTALWQSWELARVQPGSGFADWLTRYLDPIHAQLISDEGPFSACTKDRHTDVKPWPVEFTPDGYWSA